MKTGIRLIPLLLTVLMLILIAACATATPTAPVATTAPSETTATAASALTMTTAAVTTAAGAAVGEPIEISIIHRYLSANIGSQSEDTAVLTMIDEFKKDHPNVTIVEEQLQSDEYGVKAQALAAAGNITDVLTVPGAWMENFVGNELLLPMNDFFDKRPDLYEGYRPGSFDKGTLNGNIYGFPVAAGPVHLIFYNSKMLADVGYDSFPREWSEFESLLADLKADEITPIGFGNKSNSYTQYAWLSSLSDRMTGPEWTFSICDGDGASFLDQPYIDALAYLDDWRAKGYFNVDLNSVDMDMITQYYIEGKVAMFSDGIWAVQRVTSSVPEELLGVTKLDFMPTPPGGKGNPRSSAGGAGVYYSVNKNVGSTGTKFDTVMELLEYMTAEGSAKIMASVGGFPAYDPIDFDRSGLPLLAQEAYDLCVEAPQTRIFDLWFDAAVVDVMNTSTQEMMAGAKTPAQVAQDMQTEYERYLNKRSS